MDKNRRYNCTKVNIVYRITNMQTFIKRQKNGQKWTKMDKNGQKWTKMNNDEQERGKNRRYNCTKVNI